MLDASAAAASSALFVGSATVPLCTTCVLCGRCLSQFQICICVFRLVRLLSVSNPKFSLCQSASIVTKSLSSPTGASCQSKKIEQPCVHILHRHENPALRLIRYVNSTAAQRPHEATHVSIQINDICSSDTCLSSLSL